MRIILHHSFKKAYKNRIAQRKNLVLKTKRRVTLFKEDSRNPVLKDHALSGAKRKLRAFSVTGDVRIVYLPVSNDEIVFVDIGSHNQVY